MGKKKHILASPLFLETTRDTSKHVAPLSVCNRQTLENRKNAGEAETLPDQQVSVRQRRFSRPSAVIFLSLLALPSDGRMEEQLHRSPSGVPGRRQSSMSSYTLLSSSRGGGSFLRREYLSWSRSPTSLITLSACTHKQMCQCVGRVRGFAGCSKMRFLWRVFVMCATRNEIW